MLKNMHKKTGNLEDKLLTLFTQKNFADFSMSQIAEDLGISAHELSDSYPSKKEMMRCVYRLHIHRLIEGMKQGNSVTTKNPAEIIWGLYEAYQSKNLIFLRKISHDIFKHEPLLFHELLPFMKDVFIELLEPLMLKAEKMGQLKEGANVDLFLNLCVNTLFSISISQLVNPLYTEKEVNVMILNIFFRAIIKTEVLEKLESRLKDETVIEN